MLDIDLLDLWRRICCRSICADHDCIQCRDALCTDRCVAEKRYLTETEMKFIKNVTEKLVHRTDLIFRFDGNISEDEFVSILEDSL